MSVRYRHVVWDWNGTLLDDASFCVSIMNRMLARRSLPPISLPFYQAIIEFPVEGYYRKLGFDFSAEPFESVSDEFVALYQAGWRDCPLQGGALETIRSLNGSGVSQSVLSASLSSHLTEQLDHFALTDLLHSVSGAGDHHGRGKLHLARDHADATGADPSTILFIGDTAHDAEVARQAGCDCLLVSFGHYGRARLEPLGLPVAENMNEVRQFALTGQITKSWRDFEVISENALEHLALHECMFERATFSNGTLILDVSDLKVLPEHPDNPYPVARCTDVGALVFEDVEVLESFVYDASKVEKQGVDIEVDAERVPVPITTLATRFDVLYGKYLNNQEPRFVFELLGNTRITFGHVNENFACIKISFTKSYVCWNELNSDAWFVNWPPK